MGQWELVNQAMAKDFAKSFYSSAAWKHCRASYIAKRMAVDGGLCEECGGDLGYIAHHKERLSPSNIGDAAVSLNHDNLAYVCKACHDEMEEHLVTMSRPRAVFTPDGQPIRAPDAPPLADMRRPAR